MVLNILLVASFLILAGAQEEKVSTNGAVGPITTL